MPDRIGRARQTPVSVVLRVLRRKFLRALLHNRRRLQRNYCDFSLPGLCYRLEDTRHIDREGFEARRSIQLTIGKLRKFHALSSFGRPEAFVLSNSALILYTTKTTFCAKNLRKWTVLTCTNNRAVINQKKGADVGMDGIAYFEVLWLVERVSSVGIRNSGRSE